MNKEYMRRETHDLGIGIPDTGSTEGLFFLKKRYGQFIYELKNYWGIGKDDEQYNEEG